MQTAKHNFHCLSREDTVTPVTESGDLYHHALRRRSLWFIIALMD